MFPEEISETPNGPRYRTEMPGIEQPPNMNPHNQPVTRKPMNVDTIWERLCQGDQQALSRAITLLESSRSDHQRMAHDLVLRSLQVEHSAIRFGFTGVPGVGKSTLIEALGLALLENPNAKLAILAIDPSSARTGGSILGDKSRMLQLSSHPRCFIRPSPARGSLGGVTTFTREAILLCEVAGANHVFVETVGVGQSEVALHSMVDLFVVLMLAGAGDELQGIKRGILELADALVVTKADLNAEAVELAAHQLRVAMPLLRGAAVPVLTISSRDLPGIAMLMQTLIDQAAELKIEQRRAEQRVQWARELIDARIKALFGAHSPSDDLWDQVRNGSLTPQAAAEIWWARSGLP